jgi:redox-sensitive bicupin YhaK (pirin superfamily)
MSIRAVTKISQARPTREGAGVHLHRAFGFADPQEFDPFLLFDDFRNEVPEHYLAGFPWHPHRGIETITYVLSGEVEHKDSLGNKGTLKGGDVQWMTAGRGIIHQEMPKGDAAGRMHGFQLWANLPSASKMTPARYQDVESKDIPEIIDDDGTKVRVVCGSFWGKTGPVDGIAAEPQYLDVSIPAGVKKRLPVKTTNHAFAYIFEGSCKFRNGSGPMPVLTDPLGEIDTAIPILTADRSLVKFGQGEEVEVEAGPVGVRFLMVSGRPIKEPVAWRGPIVMNTQEELQQAFVDYRNGEFASPGSFHRRNS